MFCASLRGSFFFGFGIRMLNQHIQACSQTYIKTIEPERLINQYKLGYAKGCISAYQIIVNMLEV
jgi:hypothetical protein